MPTLAAVQPTFAIIPARSERRAMDWSLVLVSQGIETLIERDPHTGQWQLVVPWAERERALQALRLYQRENRRRLWQRDLPWTGLVFDWRSALWFLLLTALFGLCEGRLPELRAAGLMDSQRVSQGQWWRLFTAVTLHGDLPHLASNTSTGVVLLGLAMGSFGPGLALLASFLAGAAGNLAGLLFYGPGHRSLGASGMVMGALGLLAVQSLARARSGAPPRHLVVRGLGAGVLLLVLLGTNPRSDVLAHLAGFVAGGALGAGLLLASPRLPRSLWANRLAGLACGALLAWSWALAGASLERPTANLEQATSNAQARTLNLERRTWNVEPRPLDVER